MKARPLRAVITLALFVPLLLGAMTGFWFWMRSQPMRSVPLFLHLAAGGVLVFAAPIWVATSLVLSRTNAERRSLVLVASTLTFLLLSALAAMLADWDPEEAGFLLAIHRIMGACALLSLFLHRRTPLVAPAP